MAKGLIRYQACAISGCSGRAYGNELCKAHRESERKCDLAGCPKNKWNSTNHCEFHEKILFQGRSICHVEGCSRLATSGRSACQWHSTSSKRCAVNVCTAHRTRSSVFCGRHSKTKKKQDSSESETSYDCESDDFPDQPDAPIDDPYVTEDEDSLDGFSPDELRGRLRDLTARLDAVKTTYRLKIIDFYRLLSN